MPLATAFPSAHMQYKRMDSAPKDGSVVMVLFGGAPHPGPAFYALGKWHLWHTDDEIEPDFWCRLPADAPSDYGQTSIPARVPDSIGIIGWRFRGDALAVNEAPTWLAAANTNIVIAANTAFRLRLAVANLIPYRQQVGTNYGYMSFDIDGAGYNDLEKASVGVRLEPTASASTHGDEITTARIVATSSTPYSHGYFASDVGVINDTVLLGNGWTELEYGIIIDVGQLQNVVMTFKYMGVVLGTATVA